MDKDGQQRRGGGGQDRPVRVLQPRHYAARRREPATPAARRDLSDWFPWANPPGWSATPSRGWSSLFDGRISTAGLIRSRQILGRRGRRHHAATELDGKEHNPDYLWTKEQYGDFILELEFKIPEQANSGVFLRTADRKDPVFTGIEVQVATPSAAMTQPRRHGRGDLRLPRSSKNAIKSPASGTSTASRARATKSPSCSTASASRMDLDQWTEPEESRWHQNKFPQGDERFCPQGHIGLQDHGRPVWYRNIRIKRLPEK